MTIQYRFEHLGEVQLIGVLRAYTTGEAMQQDIPAFWQEMNEAGVVKALTQYSNQMLTGLLGVIIPRENSIDYFIGVPHDDLNSNDSDFEAIKLMAHNYVVIDAKGRVPEAIKAVMPKIYTELLPQAAFKTIQAPMFEHYLPGNTQSPDYITEIWMPIKE
ncbi:GyrI-like domain-containing protein [Staphylococcus sp. GDX8P80P]|uniref:GyrI-like domain-containing protein n=1 Tax=Staphylococcus sp. GDX8P80P TaxID=2804104 RepID=UPI001AEBEF2D|nr:GyrI-like domain-containing protein [Staphylococcus sp. GDX8P80P]